MCHMENTYDKTKLIFTPNYLNLHKLLDFFLQINCNLCNKWVQFITTNPRNSPLKIIIMGWQ